MGRWCSRSKSPTACSSVWCSGTQRQMKSTWSTWRTWQTSKEKESSAQFSPSWTNNSLRWICATPLAPSSRAKKLLWMQLCMACRRLTSWCAPSIMSIFGSIKAKLPGSPCSSHPPRWGTGRSAARSPGASMISLTWMPCMIPAPSTTPKKQRTPFVAWQWGNICSSWGGKAGCWGDSLSHTSPKKPSSSGSPCPLWSASTVTARGLPWWTFPACSTCWRSMHREATC